jgi:polyisoprenoid-binding protein YceI
MRLAAVAIWLTPALAPAQSAARDSIVYLISPASRLEVRTGKAGLFGFAGHEHVIRARAFSGRVVYHSDAPESSRIELVVLTDSLEVLTPADTEEIRKVTAAMRTDVLKVARYPEIRFVSQMVTPSEAGLHIISALTLVGRTRGVPVDVTLAIGTDTLRAAATFTVKQSDFGITPYRGGPAGTVRVADRVTFEIHAMAVRETTRSNP